MPDNQISLLADYGISVIKKDGKYYWTATSEGFDTPEAAFQNANQFHRDLYTEIGPVSVLDTDFFISALKNFEEGLRRKSRMTGPSAIDSDLSAMDEQEDIDD